MNNPFQVMRALNNPQQMLNQVMNDSRLMQDPRAKRAMSMYQNHDTQGLKNMAENLCKSYNITTDEAQNRVRSMFGM